MIWFKWKKYQGPEPEPRKDQETGSGRDPQSELQKALEQAETWRNRAAMAWQENNRDLVQQALTRMWHYQVAAANLEGRDPPEGHPEPEDIFRGWERY